MFKHFYVVDGIRKSVTSTDSDSLYAVMEAEKATNIRIEGKCFVITKHNCHYTATNVRRIRISSVK